MKSGKILSSTYYPCMGDGSCWLSSAGALLLGEYSLRRLQIRERPKLGGNIVAALIPHARRKVPVIVRFWDAFLSVW